MSQTQASTSGMSSGARSAMAVGIIALVLGAAALGFTVYQSFVSVPNQFSSLPVVNQRPSNLNITIEWTLPFGVSSPNAKDRFFPPFITIAQGDTVNLLFISNDTGDAHTFTVTLPTSTPGVFQLNNSLPGLNNFLTGKKFTTNPTGCSNQNAVPTSCNTVTTYHSTIGNETSSGSFTVTTPGTYRYWCQYHQKLGMFGWLIVLPNKGFTG